MLDDIVDKYNLAIEAIRLNTSANTDESHRNVASALNNWAWQLALNGVYLVPNNDIEVNDMLTDDYCSRISVGPSSISNAAVSARTALCLLESSKDPHLESPKDSLWLSFADTFAYVLLQSSSRAASEQNKDRLLRAAIGYWTKPDHDWTPKAYAGAIFRLAIAESAAGSEPNSKEHMTAAIKEGYRPSHEFGLVQKYFDPKKYMKIRNELGIGTGPIHETPSCPT